MNVPSLRNRMYKDLVLYSHEQGRQCLAWGYNGVARRRLQTPAESEKPRGLHEGVVANAHLDKTLALVRMKSF